MWAILVYMIGLSSISANKITEMPTMKKEVKTREKDMFEASNLNSDLYLESNLIDNDDDYNDFSSISGDGSGYDISDNEDVFRKLRQKLKNNFKEFRELLHSLRIADRKEILKFKEKIINTIEKEMYKNINEVMVKFSKFFKEEIVQYNYTVLGVVVYCLGHLLFFAGIIVGIVIDKLYRMI